MNIRSFLAAMILITTQVPRAGACSIFRSPFVGDQRMAHNVDWDADFELRGAITLNPASLRKRAELLGAPHPLAEWTSRFPSVTFSTMGAEFPVEGFNDQGLFLAVLELPESQYPGENDPRPALSLTQFVQYNLDVSRSVDEVILSDLAIRPYSGSFKMHFIACDAGGCAVLQYIEGALRVYRGADLPFAQLTNSLYPESAEAARSCSSLETCEAADTSLLRFARANLLRERIQAGEEYEPQAFRALEGVMQSAGSRTQFQMVADPADRKIFIRKRGAAGVGRLDVDFREARCDGARLVIPINDSTAGDLGGSWIPLTREMQTEMALKMGLPAVAAQIYGRYPFETIRCVGR